MSQDKTKTLAITAMSLAGSVIGLMSQFLIAYQFGVTVAVDALYFSLATPMFVGGLVASAIGLYAPAKFRASLSADQGRLNESAAGSAVKLKCLFILVVFSGLAAWVQEISLPDTSGLALYENLALMITCGWLFSAIWVAMAVQSAALLARQDVVYAALAQAGPALGGLAGLLTLSPVMGPVAFMVGQLIGGAVSLMLVWPRVANVISAELPRLLDDLMHKKGWPLVYSALAMLSFSSYPIIDSLLAPRMGAGVMASIAISQRIIIGLGTTIIAAPFSIFAARFADIAHDGSAAQHSALLRKILLAYTPILLALMAAISAFSLSLTRILMNGDESHIGVAAAVRQMSPGMGFMLISAIIYRAVSPLRNGEKYLAMIGVTWLASYGLLGFISFSEGLNGLAASYTGAWMITVAVAIFLLRRCSVRHFGGGELS